MKPPYAHVSGTAFAALAAAGSVWLSVFFLPGSGVQPVPLLPAIGSAAVKVASSLQPHAKKHVAAPHRTAAPVVAPAVVLTQTVMRRVVAHPRPQARVVHRAHARRPAHAPAPQPRPAARVEEAAAPAPLPASPPASEAPNGVAKGWHRKHDQASAAAAPVREHSKEHGRSSDHHRGTPPSQERTQFAPTTAPQPAGEATRHDNGKHGGWDGRGNHGDHGHDHEGHGSGGHK